MEKIESKSGNGRRVVVIGGGITGSRVTKYLQFDSDLTLIDPKEYFEITWASLRSTEVLTADGLVVGHDYLVIATGHNDVLPKTRQEKISQYQADGESQTNWDRGCRYYRGCEKSYNPQRRMSSKWVRSEETPKGKEIQGNVIQKCDGICFRCGSKGHWSRVCRTPPHLCKLYKESLKGKKKEVKLMKHFEGTTYLNASDFANDFDETTHTDN